MGLPGKMLAHIVGGYLIHGSAVKIFNGMNGFDDVYTKVLNI